MTKILHLIDNEPSFFYYQENLFTETDLIEIKKYLFDLELNKQFKDGHCLTGKEVPRKQIWYQEEKEYFCNSWKIRYPRWKSDNYEPYLKSIQSYVNKFTTSIILKSLQDHLDNNIQLPKFNSCLINLYRNGNDSIKPHRDTKDSFGVYPTIANVSIGETRTMRIKKTLYNSEGSDSLKNDTNSDLDLEFELKDNSLLIMSGASQKYFTHEIPKENNRDKRYSLTFREYLYS